MKNTSMSTASYKSFSINLIKCVVCFSCLFFCFSSILAKAEQTLIELDSTLIHQLQSGIYRPQQKIYFAASSNYENNDEGRLVSTFPKQVNTTNKYWLRFTVYNNSLIQSTLVIPTFGRRCDIYINNVQLEKNEDWIPPNNKKTKQKSNLYQKYKFISLSPNTIQEIVVKYQSKSDLDEVDFWLASQDWFHKVEQPKIIKSVIIQAFFLGIFFSIFLYHLITYFDNSNRAFFFYSCYCFSLICSFYFHPINELFQQVNLYFSVSEAIWQIVQLFSGAGMIIFYLFFCVYLVHIYDKNARLRKSLMLLAYLFAADLGLALLQVGVWGFDYMPQEHFILALLSFIRTLFFWIAMIFVFGVLFYYLLSKNRLVQLLGLSSLFFAIGGTIFALLDYKIYLFNDEANNYRFFQITSILQLMTCALLLSYRSRRTEHEKIALQELDVTKSRFFANISHEFRTPLTLILGPVSDLLTNNYSQKERQLLKLIQKNGQRLLRLVNQILELAKLDAGTTEINAQPNDFARFTQQITSSFSSLAESKNIRLSFKAHPNECWTAFDWDHFEKIIFNLIANAIKYTPPNGFVDVTVNADFTKNQVVLNVQDSGIGIPEALLHRIFDRFYQARSDDYTTDLPSTGIGLALTKELVELNGGNIMVHSALQKGSTFSVTFPLRKVNPVQTDVSPDVVLLVEDVAPPLSSTKDKRKTTSKPLVLIIEDNEDVLVYIQGCLEKEFEITIACDGREGVEKAIAQVPDLVIADVMMPKKDGFQVTKELKAHDATSHIPIIILTGKSSKESRLHGLEIDADEYLTKPFDATELSVRIQNLLRNRQRLQAYYRKNWWIKPADQKVLSREEVFLAKAAETIEQNLSNENFTVEDLSAALHMSRYQLFNKLRALVNTNPSGFIRSYRLQRAKQLLEANAGTASEIAFMVGFSDVSYFSKRFKEEFGFTPGSIKPKK